VWLTAGFAVTDPSSVLVKSMISRSDTYSPMALTSRMQPPFLAVPNTIPSVISNRIYTFPKYAAFPAHYPEVERRSVDSRIAVAG
jgi:hypothetical protein